MLGAAFLPVLIRVLLLGVVPLGVDGGQWVALGRSFFSFENPRDLYPPLVPLSSWLLSLLLPLRGALGIVAVLSAAAPGLGVGFFARRVGMAPLGVCVAAFGVSATGMTGEAFLWAGYPQLLALGFVPLALLAADELTAVSSSRVHSTRSSQVLLVSALLTIAATSHLVLLSTVCALGSLAVVRSRALRTSSTRQALKRPALVVLLGGLLLVPVYRSLAETFSAGSSSSNVSSASQAFEMSRYLLRSERWLYAGLLIVALIGVARLRRPAPGLLASLVAVVVAVILPVVLEERRLAYVSATALAMLLVSVFSHPLEKKTSPKRASSPSRPLNKLLGGCVCTVVLLSGGLGLSRAKTDNEFYSFVTPSALALAEQVGELSSPSETVAVASVRALPYGWWVEGASGRRTLSMTSSSVLYRAAEQRDLEVTLAVFKATPDDPFPSETGLAAARQNEVGLLVVPWDWGGATSAEIDAHLKQCAPTCGFSLVYENSFGAILRVSE
jgi:hypothetical protein